MNVLVLDTIHGGSVLAEELRRQGYSVDAVDVYHGQALSKCEAEQRNYDLIAAPVHLNPDYPLLGLSVPQITHHQMVKRLVPSCNARIIEITGSQGKTSTAYAVAAILPGRTILHTSAGTWVYPEKKFLFKRSITPASLLYVISSAVLEKADWIVAEESLGVCGVGELGILTSDGDYRIASGKKSALDAKMTSLRACPQILVPKSCVREEGMHAYEEYVSVTGTVYSTLSNGSFENRLAEFPVYRNALLIAAAVAEILQVSVSPLATFSGVEGRMMYEEIDGVPILDNSNSGINPEIICQSASYLTQKTGKKIVLVTGEGAHAVCEGLSPENIDAIIETISPLAVIRSAGESFDELRLRALALAKKNNGAVLIGIKTWR